MDRKVRKIGSSPNYRKIYNDILEQKFPDKISQCRSFLAKSALSTLDIISLNQIIFGNERTRNENLNFKHRSYDEKSVLEILAYQRENKLNNSQLSAFYRISRTTIAKWKKQYTQNNY